ncbi:hypothetical protein EUX98_g6208 [Antrodiella citrinella]|uniref:Peptidase S33 tripeptidyl aminopeptidase-like C-terminal domain-containing protein n=1 Tax=Antrodiella citrinella TaxID=2447956 RepID=A0A4S4MRF6_9APHY|nr:hypothetical protein EUX98_g6208 [Antrodiella citrinella]
MSLPKHSDPACDSVRSHSGGYTLLKAVVLIGSVALVAYQFSHFELLRFALPPSVDSDAQDGYGFDWTSIIPAQDLEWTQCYNDFECARLSVPLDYSHPKGGKAAIAIVRYPSDIAHDEEGYLGPVLFNPGGPGASGIEMVLNNAQQLRIILGEGYDLIGFDPRGVGFTTPTLHVFESSGEAAFIYAKFLPTINSSDTALGAMYAAAKTLGVVAKARMGDVAQHVGTPVVARDMLSIVKAHRQEKIQYWGSSYGTVLGATFAAMFPDNVGRLVLDGVMDAEDYYSAQRSTSLLDTDATLFGIYQACVDAGPLVCPIHESSTEKIHDRIQKLVNSLRSNPATFYNADTGSHGEVDYSLVQKVIFISLYRPYESGMKLASVLADLERGVAEPIFRLSQAEATEEAMKESFTDDVVALRKHYNSLSQVSMFSEIWYARLGCAGWKVRAKERFAASWETNTSFPLLIIGNTADPVTPLRSAMKMSRGFKDSVVLTQDSLGHGSIAAASLCTAKAVRAYFQNGTLPEDGTVCAVESRMFDEQLSISGTLSAEDRKLLQASHELQQNYVVTFL